MRIVTLSFLFLALAHLALGQQVLELKSNERMNGKCETLINDTLVFDFKGNKLHFPVSQIRTIYFDGQSASNSQASESQRLATVSGVVTFFFNNNYGDKPDAGADIYVLDSTKCGNLQVKKIFDFKIGTGYYQMAADYKAHKKEVPDDVKKKLIKYGVESEEKYKALESDAADTFIKLTMSHDAVHLTADGSGGFSKSLEPGTYFVVMQSKHRQSLNTLEINGSINYQTIRIASGEQKNLSYSFPVTEI